jgi:hypothetical protein
MTETREIVPVRRWAMACALAASAVAAQSAHAEQVLLSTSTTISGTQSAVYAFNTPGAGTLNVTLGNYTWPERLGNLSFALATTTGVLKTLSGEGSLSIDLTEGGSYYALVSGTATGKWNLGMYSLNLSFGTLADPGGPPPVPLPGALWLLLSGIAGAWALARKPGAAPEMSAA